MFNTMFKSKEGGEGRLVELCLGYFISYVFTSIAVKYFTGSASQGLPGIGQIEYLIYSTIGSSALALAIVIIGRWYKLKSNHITQIGFLKFPIEYLYIIPSGICAAIVIPTTTLMYLLPISVMVAMVIMRGSIIIVSRIIDAILIKQGILKKKVYWEEEVAVVFALLAMCTDIFFNKQAAGFDFIHSKPAVIILSSYILSYFLRLYIMNYYKNTRGKGVPQDNKGFFAIEQFAATATMILLGVIIYNLTIQGPAPRLNEFKQAFSLPSIHWHFEILAGFAYGIGAFFSVFLFLFKGRTATFSSLVNRLTSLAAGTVGTLLFALFFHANMPSIAEWTSLFIICISIGFLTKADKKRVAEMKKSHEL